MKLTLIMVTIILTIPSLVCSQDLSNYLILDDIGSYKRITKGGSSGSILAGAGHFALDHKDKSYGIAYANDETQIWVDVQVVHHAGSDSDKWLLHEIDRDFRNYYGLPGDSYVIRVIDGKTIMAAGSGGWTYRWVSVNKVIHIEYTDLQMEKPEPLEVVKAYLTKHPSSLPLMTSTDLRTHDNRTIWIKDEMDRRLWLSDKWFLQIQVGKVESSEALQTIVKSMNVFLDYREKYYDISAKSEKELLSGYLEARNGTAIKSKLAEYKTWWSVNKTKSINLP